MIEITKTEYDILSAIKEIVRKGNAAEVKRENGNLVVIEIKRKVNTKRPL